MTFAVLFGFAVDVAQAQISVVKGEAAAPGEVSAGGVYAQDFDSLPAATGTRPDKAQALEWENNATLRGWFRDVANSKGDFSASGAYTDAPAFFNYGLDGGSNRSIGVRSVKGGASDAAVAVVFQNNTGAPIKGVRISYTGRQWRRQSGAASTLAVGWRFFGKEFKPGAFPARDKQWWTDVPELAFTAPQLEGANVLNGTAPECMRQFPATEVIFRRGAFAGEYFSIRWYYPTNPEMTGSGLAVDDVKIEFIR